ncbi:hypothetical protein CWI39_2114p0010 [Hamiltosporidium magnivora]|uniref:Uncharacterized protein n=1 Tax=Hamiltosporidium magnivora TaxID=148818 RepID=A0A4Q9KWB1_9MICR|nr:hypothetical protein CWI39_2114p0010 [Hamiltosporidium magnivora]
MCIISKPLQWILSSSLLLIIALGTLGFLSYRSASKYIENLESDYKKISELDSFRTLAGDLKRERIAMLSEMKDDIKFTVFKIKDANDRKNLLDALDKKKNGEVQESSSILISTNTAYIIPIKRPSRLGDINFLTKVGFLLKKKTTMQTISELTAYIGKKPKSSDDANKTVMIFFNIIDEKKVGIFCVESEDGVVKKTNKEQIFIIKHPSKNIKGEISDFIAYIIEKNRKEESKTEKKAKQ